LIDGRHCESAGEIIDVHLHEHAAVIIEAGRVGPIPYRSTWTFYHHDRRIDWRGTLTFDGQWIGRPKHATDIDDKAGAATHCVPAFDDHEYKLRLRFFPFLSPFATGIRDFPFGVAETDDRYLNGNYWTAASDGHVGLALFNRGQMGSLREPDGALSSVLAFALPYVWGTRMLHGEYHYELSVLPFLGDWRIADLHRSALAYNFPFVTTRVAQSNASLGDSWSPYREGGRDALLTALYERNNQVYARFFEQQGSSAEVAFDWMDMPATMQTVDLREHPQGEVSQRIHLGPWQIKTVAIAG
jgi:hypothetical protein